MLVLGGINWTADAPSALIGKLFSEISVRDPDDEDGTWISSSL